MDNVIEFKAYRKKKAKEKNGNQEEFPFDSSIKVNQLKKERLNKYRQRKNKSLLSNLGLRS